MNWRNITRDELDVFLRKHKLWLANEPGGERVNLRGANLSGANLRGANLRGANLRGANLRGANLDHADLSGADLIGANLFRTNLFRTNLYNANLRGANLRGANLDHADLSGADLIGANLSGANLIGANLYNANLIEANLENAKNIYYPISCPEKGSFTAFKKVKYDYIVELEVPEDSKRCSATSRKCRCSHAKVISITNYDGSPADVDVVYSKYDDTFSYSVGQIVKVDDFDPNRWHECAPGIHFFITRQEAVDY